jgi:alcohol dehydrogenase (cytochrome c)
MTSEPNRARPCNRIGGLLGAVGGALFLSLGAWAQVSPTYSEAQAAAGKVVYDRQCKSCHGETLDDGEFGPVLRGPDFLVRWSGKSVEELFHYTVERMPVTQPGGLSEDEYINLVAFMLAGNGVYAGEALTTANQKQMTLPTTTSSVGLVAAGVKLPPNPVARPNPLARIRPVTEQMIASPPDESWLGWRRTRDAQGFSPLKQITNKNVGKLQLGWSLALPPGPNQMTPIVHDGVMFVHAFNEVVQAIDAVTGDILWQYNYRLPKEIQPVTKKSMAILDNMLFVPTSDARMIALDVKTGNVIWNTDVGAVAPGSAGSGIWQSYSISGGPIIAKGKVIFGTRGPKPFIVALDAKTGKEAWRFLTLPKPGELGGETWNGLDWDKRSGGVIWTPGSYDAVTNLVFFGPSPTYDTKPLRDRLPGKNNDALFTNTTLAINPDTGKLVWHFQHLANDQWDLDWAYEREIVTLGKGKSARRALVTSGKMGLHDLLDPATGQYLYSIDLGMQNIVTAIDPKTGAKTINEDLVPGDGTTKLICPHAGGGKNYNPSGFDPGAQVLFVPFSENCMDLHPVPEGQRGSLTTGVRWAVRPAMNSDGYNGRLAAINLDTKKTMWITRERTPFVTGTLPTAGGVVFAGGVDRYFSAYDSRNGKKLWTTRLNDVPNSNPISYAVNGKQYVAIITGGGAPHTTDSINLTPEVKNPIFRTSSIWVFQVN